MTTAEGFTCPITWEVVTDEVAITACGQAYSTDGIRRWFAAGNASDPATGVRLPHTDLVICRFEGDLNVLHRAICSARGVPFDACIRQLGIEVSTRELSVQSRERLQQVCQDLIYRGRGAPVDTLCYVRHHARCIHFLLTTRPHLLSSQLVLCFGNLRRAHDKERRRHHRRNFDVFRRQWNRIVVRWCADEDLVTVETTVGQLAFCVWLDRHDGAALFERHLVSIQETMRMAFKERE